MLTTATGLGRPEMLQLEIAFYRFAHVAEERKASLGELRRLIFAGIRSPRFDLSANVQRARDDGHPEPELLGDLARVIADEAPADILDRHTGWAAGGS